MDKAKRRNQTVVAEIREIGPYLEAGKLTFINNSFVGEGCYIESNSVLLYSIRNGVAGIISKEEKLSFKLIRIIDMIRTGNEYLFHFGLY